MEFETRVSKSVGKLRATRDLSPWCDEEGEQAVSSQQAASAENLAGVPLQFKGYSAAVIKLRNWCLYLKKLIFLSVDLKKLIFYTFQKNIAAKRVPLC